MHPPGYYLFMHFWYAIVGHNDIPLRLPSMVFGALSVVLLFIIGREFFDEIAAGVGAVLFAVSPMMIELSSSVRPYSLLTFAFLISLLCLLRILKGNTLKHHAANSAACFLAMFVHYYGVFLPLYQFACLLCFRETHRAQLKTWLLFQTGVAAAYLPFAYIALTHQLRLVNPYGGAWLLTLIEFLKLLYAVSPLGHKFVISPSPWLIALGLAFLGLAAAGMFPVKRNLILILYVALPVILVAAVSNIARLKFYQPYHFIFLVPTYMLFVAGGLRKFGKPGLVAGALIVVASSAMPLGTPEPDWKECAKFLRTHSRTRDTITICCPTLGDALLYYLPDADIVAIEDVLAGQNLRERLWLVLVYEDIYFTADARKNMFHQLSRLGFASMQMQEEIENVNVFLCWRRSD
jgi:uncharacterized membrane protein